MAGECDRSSVSDEAIDVSGRAFGSDVEKYLESHPQVVQKWLLEKAEPEFLQRLLQFREYRSGPGGDQEGSRSSSTGSLHQDGHNSSNSGNSGNGGNGGGIIPRSKRNSITSELFRTWLAASPIKRAKSPSR
jgi:hypothetical protein